MVNPRPTVPLVPDLVDIRLRRMKNSGADEQLFPGFGIGFGFRGIT